MKKKIFFSNTAKASDKDLKRIKVKIISKLKQHKKKYNSDINNYILIKVTKIRKKFLCLLITQKEDQDQLKKTI